MARNHRYDSSLDSSALFGAKVGTREVLDECPQGFQFSGGETRGLREVSAQVGSQAIDDTRPPASIALSVQDVVADAPIEEKQLLVDGKSWH